MSTMTSPRRNYREIGRYNLVPAVCFVLKIDTLEIVVQIAGENEGSIKSVGNTHLNVFSTNTNKHHCRYHNTTRIISQKIKHSTNALRYEKPKCNRKSPSSLSFPSQLLQLPYEPHTTMATIMVLVLSSTSPAQMDPMVS